MSKPTEFKLASDIIKRVLEAVDKGDVDYLRQLKSVGRKRQDQARSTTQAALDLKGEALAQRPATHSESSLNPEYLNREFMRFETVNELRNHLLDRYSTKAEIVAVARALHVPTPKSDDFDAVADRIVDATIGYKLRSMAVRGPLPTREKKPET